MNASPSAQRWSSVLRGPAPRFWCLWLFACSLAAPSAWAAAKIVATSEELSAALAGASAGDEIVLRDGDYRGQFSLVQSATAEAPIVVRAEHPLKATSRDSSWKLSGDHSILRDCAFERSQVGITGNDNEVASNTFRHGREQPRLLKAAVWTTGTASRNRIHHNEVTEWNTFGFRVWEPDAQATGNRFDHNYIHDYSNKSSGNEPEVFQIGSNQTSSQAQIATVVEYNLVERVQITGELLSLKSSGNLIRGNTFVEIHGTIQGRHGCDNTFLNNTVLGGQTVLRAYGDRHRLIGNRLVGVDLIVPPGDITEDALRKIDGHGAHPAARDQLVAGNVLEQGGRIVLGDGGRESFSIPCQDTIVAGNQGPVVSEAPGLKQTGTKLLSTYEGDAGQAVLMTREQVGPWGR